MTINTDDTRVTPEKIFEDIISFRTDEAIDMLLEIGIADSIIEDCFAKDSFMSFSFMSSKDIIQQCFESYESPLLAKMIQNWWYKQNMETCAWILDKYACKKARTMVLLHKLASINHDYYNIRRDIMDLDNFVTGSQMHKGRKPLYSAREQIYIDVINMDSLQAILTHNLNFQKFDPRYDRYQLPNYSEYIKNQKMPIDLKHYLIKKMFYLEDTPKTSAYKNKLTADFMKSVKQADLIRALFPQPWHLDVAGAMQAYLAVKVRPRKV